MSGAPGQRNRRLSLPVADWRASLFGALDGSAFTIPLSLGCVTLVYAQIGRDVLTSGIFATLLALAWLHLGLARAQRPILYSARFFEATTLAALLERLVARLDGWSIADTQGTRLALLCLICGAAGVVVGVLYLVRGHRFTRFIPTAVFAGFSNAIALVLLITQSRSLWSQLTQTGMQFTVLSIALPVLLTSFAVRRWRPKWPAAASGLALGLLIGLGWMATGVTPPMVTGQGWSLTLPVVLADFAALAAPDADTWGLAGVIATDACILGIMIFINTTMTSEVMSQSDDRPPGSVREQLWSAASMTLAGLVGSVPLSGSMQSSAAATRTVRMGTALLVFCGLISAVMYLTGVLLWIPLAAVCGALLGEAWFMVDRGSLQLLRDWLARRTQVANAGEDLALVGAVTAAAVLFNMVAAVVLGLLMGLVLFAARSAAQPVRHVWSGAQLSSNCARSRSDLRLLAQHGSEIRVFELEGDLFFGVADGLARLLRAQIHDVSCAVLDWSRVKHLDTGVAVAIAKFERHAKLAGVTVIHAGAGLRGWQAADVLRRHLPVSRMAPDLDRALELAENLVIERHADPLAEVTTSFEAAALFNGLSEADRQLIESRMPERRYAAGEAIVTAGDRSDELMLVLYGTASVVVRTPEGRDIRLAGVRRGSTLGEIGFLDHAPRSATIVAQEDVTVAVLQRSDWDALAQSHPALVQRLLANITLDVAARLRHTNRLAMARQSQG